MPAAYALLDSGEGRKLEQFGDYLISRPASQALWQCQHSELWKKADAYFTREPKGVWQGTTRLPMSWILDHVGLKFKVAPTDFGHLGIFPEHAETWKWMSECIRPKDKVLNLFAYSGGISLAAARAGAEVCHVDASKGMVAWARDNAALNGLQSASIRWIVDDVFKFLAREIRRGNTYEGIVLDPPSFGRGAKGEVFKIEEHLPQLLATCRQLLSKTPAFMILSCHTPGLTPISLQNLLSQCMKGTSGKIDAGEMVLRGEGDVLPLPSGTYARWKGERS